MPNLTSGHAWSGGSSPELVRPPRRLDPEVVDARLRSMEPLLARPAELPWGLLEVEPGV